jgi:excisionase family DNA binding protein
VSGINSPNNPAPSSSASLYKLEKKESLGTSNTHLTPAQAARLLGCSPARVRQMIRFGELTQELVGDRWLIPVKDINRTLNPSSEPERDYKTPASPLKQLSKHNEKRHQGNSSQSTGPSSHQSISKAPTNNKTRGLAAEIERLDKRMKQIDGELKDLRSGFMSDEKRERTEQLKTEKRKCGKNLQKLQRELAKRER